MAAIERPIGLGRLCAKSTITVKGETAREVFPAAACLIADALPKRECILVAIG
jgi:hypothetical protein